MATCGVHISDVLPTGECPQFNIELSSYLFITQLVILDTTLEWRLNPLKKFIPKWFNPIRSSHNIGLALRTIKKKEVIQIVEQDGSSLGLSLCQSATVGIKNSAKKRVITWLQVTLTANLYWIILIEFNELIMTYDHYPAVSMMDSYCWWVH